MTRRHIQPRIPGERRILRGSSFMRQLEAAVLREAKRFNVSPAFVIATAVADALGVKEQVDYTTIDAGKRPKPRLVKSA